MEISGWQVEQITTFERFNDLEAEWNSLAKDHVKTIFLTHAWLSQWWQVFGSDYHLLTLAVRKDGALVGVLPLMLHHHSGGFRHLSFMGAGAITRSYSQEILSLVYAHCLDYRSLNHMPSWFERTDLNFLLDLEGLTERRLVGALNHLKSLDSEAWQRRLFQGVCRQYRLRPSGVIYDVTNTYLYGRHCPLGKPGRDKEEVKGRPLIQVGLGVTQEEGIPLFHKVFDGNVHHARTLQDLVTRFASYDLGPGLFIYDRGITSGRNLQDITRLHWDTLCGVLWPQNCVG